MEAYYDAENNILPISNKILTDNLPKHTEIRNKIYECMLYKYIQKKDLNCSNVTEVTKIIISNCIEHKFDINVVIQILKKENIDGTMFQKNDTSFRNSTQFATMFRNINGYNKKQFENLYTKINKWKPIYIKKQGHMQHILDFKTQKQTATESHVYEFGTRFYFW
eukprot:36960_1